MEHEKEEPWLEPLKFSKWIAGAIIISWVFSLGWYLLFPECFEGIKQCEWLRALINVDALCQVIETLGLCGLIFGALLAIAEQKVCNIKIGELIQWRFPGFFVLYFAELLIMLFGIYASTAGWRALATMTMMPIALGVLYIGVVSYTFLLNFEKRELTAYSFHWAHMGTTLKPQVWQPMEQVALFVGEQRQEGRDAQLNLVAKLCERAINETVKDKAVNRNKLILSAKDFWNMLFLNCTSHRVQIDLIREILTELEGLDAETGVSIFAIGLMLELSERLRLDTWNMEEEDGVEGENPVRAHEKMWIHSMGRLTEQGGGLTSSAISDKLRSILVWTCGMILMVDYSYTECRFQAKTIEYFNENKPLLDKVDWNVLADTRDAYCYKEEERSRQEMTAEERNEEGNCLKRQLQSFWEQLAEHSEER